MERERMSSHRSSLTPVFGFALLALGACGADGGLATDVDLGADLGGDLAADLGDPDVSEDVGGADVSDGDLGDPDATDVTTDGGDAAGGGDADAGGIAFCEGPTRQVYDPEGADDIQLWPDTRYERADASSPTGVRLFVSDARWVRRLPAPVTAVVAGLERASGFATLGGAFFTFDGTLTGLPESLEDSLGSEAYVFYDLDAEPPARVPYLASYSDRETSVILQPALPLALGHRYLVAVTTAARDEDGGCAAPAALTAALLSEPEGARSDVASRWHQALAAVELDAAEVSAMTVFTVHEDTADFAVIAADINTRALAWDTDAAICEERELWRRCDLFYEAHDYRAGDVGFALEPQGTNRVPVRVWLPLDDSEPATPIIFGHGANTTRDLGAEVADELAPLGFAIIAQDALEHGDHPYRTGDDPDDDFIRMMGVDLTAFTIDPAVLEQNFNQSVLEWTQLTELVRRDGDLDGEAGAEVDSSRIAYLGFSLGGMLGTGVAALSDDVEAALISIAGGQLLTFLTGNPQVVEYRPALALLAGGEDPLDRFLVAAQSSVDAGDPALWGAHVLRDRVFGERIPHILMPTTLHDEIVAPPAANALARAYGLDHGRPVYEPVTLLEPIDLPVAGNRDGTTAVFVQFDTATRDGETIEPEHGDLPRTDEATAQMVHFFETWRDDGVPEAIMPVEAAE
jgi:dienelactone hydrolase